MTRIIIHNALGKEVGWFDASLCSNDEQLIHAMKETMLFAEFQEFGKKFDVGSHSPVAVLHWSHIEPPHRKKGWAHKGVLSFLASARRNGAKLALLKVAYESGRDWKKELRWKSEFYQKSGFQGFSHDDVRSPLMYCTLQEKS